MIHVLKKQSIFDYIDANPNSAKGLSAWLDIVRYSNWAKPEDIVKEFGPKAIDLLGKKDNKPTTISCERVVFDVKGNHIRIIAKYKFHPNLKVSRLYIKWIGNHSDYDKLCAENKQYDIEMFK